VAGSPPGNGTAGGGDGAPERGSRGSPFFPAVAVMIWRGILLRQLPLIVLMVIGAAPVVVVLIIVKGA
jgi:hypothetical protein